MSTRQSVEDVNLSTCQHVMKSQISRSVKCHEVINFLSSFQELLVFFAIFCQLLPFFLHLFGTFLYFCQFWHCLATFGILWQLFAIFLQLLPGFDSFEQFFAMFWQPLTILGKFWKIWQLLPLMVPVSPCHQVILSSCRLFISSYFRPVNLSACLFVSL